MKNSYLIFFIIMLLSSCQGFFDPKIEGKWQLKTVEKDGTTTAVDTVWYNFQSESVFALQFYIPQQDTFIILYGMRTQTDDVMSVILNNEAYFDHIDWTQRTRSFTVTDVTNKRLALRSEEGYNYIFGRF
ncbi:MAG: hypothetical protein LBT42_01305 [Tannerella sp.]|jgi:hypothetical protein|nr:hypothetical protein [Tannerella sp.]